MIDVEAETLIPPRQAAKLLPSSITGKRVHISTIHRWFASGVLEYIRVGGRRFTSKEAILRFISRANPAMAEAFQSTPTIPVVSKSAAALTAMRRLEQIGI